VRVAVLSDVHSNSFALRAVLRDVEEAGIGEVWFAGDAFGYYPWAAETFALIEQAKPSVAVIGNHDRWVLDTASAPAGLVGDIARENAKELSQSARSWLTGLKPALRVERGGLEITIAHGTPDDPLEGRYYPDDNGAHEWLPAAGDVLIMGQTHYPLLRSDASRGLLLNPGSVGQPRDGNPMPSWAVLDLASGQAELRRTAYDNISAMSKLEALGWDRQVTRALDKR
jgi:predicted phosphodiesterase